MTDRATSPTCKLPYATPVVQVYGTIRQLTHSPNNKGASDNGAAGSAKTKA